MNDINQYPDPDCPAAAEAAGRCPAEEGATNSFARRPRRKRAPPAHRRPKHSEAMKRRWQDPEYRAKQEAHFAARRADPTKSWSRRGIPDGFTRETAAQAWQAAEEKAKLAMRALKKLGLV